VRLDSTSVNSAANRAQTCAALRQCASITAVQLGTCTNLDDSGLRQLISAVPALRVLQFHSATVSSLRFLQHAPGLKELHLTHCQMVRPTHLLVLGTVAPQLHVLRVHDCSGVQLDEWEL
jgi:hypothetical protein